MISSNTFCYYLYGGEKLVKQRKTVSLDTNLVHQIRCKFPKQSRNFSAFVEGSLLVVLNEPEKFWRAKAKYHYQMFQLCHQQANFEKEFKKTKYTAETRKEILTKIINEKV